MSYDDRLINEINAKIVLSDFIGRKVSLTKRGREFIGLCPFHKEKTPSFTINDDKNFFHCFGCGAHGNAINFIMKHQNIEFLEALKVICKDLGLDLSKYSNNYRNYPKKEIENIHKILKSCNEYFVENFNSLRGDVAKRYLIDRNISSEYIKNFSVGYAIKGSSNLFSHLKKCSYDEDFLIRSGVIAKSEKNQQYYDFFRSRLMFPIHNHRGELIAFGGRSLDNSDPKYLNSPDTVLFKKRQTLFNYHRAKDFILKTDENLIVVEGYIDVISLTQAGFKNVVAPLGTALSEEQILLLWKACDEPIICMDGDPAGYRSAQRALDIALQILKPGKSLSFAFLMDSEDPDSMIQSGKIKLLERLFNAPITMFDFCWKLQFEQTKIDTPERRAGFKSRFEKKIASIKDYEVRKEYKKSFELDFSKLLSGVKSFSGKKFNQQSFISNENVRINKVKRENNSYSREKNLILAVINNPFVLNRINEEFSKIPLVNEDIVKLRTLITDKFVDIGFIEEDNIINLENFLESNELVNNFKKENNADKIKLLPPYVSKNEDIDFVEIGWKEAAKLQNIWYKKQKIKQYVNK